MKRTLLLLSLLVVSGCQGLQELSKTAAVDNATFMHMWNVYTHCQSSADPDTLRLDARRLEQASVPVAPSRGLPLPAPIRRWIADPPTRLAVDPKAMAAACTVHAGQAALAAEKYEMATELFLTVMQRHSQAEYAYYIDQARAGLAQASLGLQASMQARRRSREMVLVASQSFPIHPPMRTVQSSLPVIPVGSAPVGSAAGTRWSESLPD